MKSKEVAGRVHAALAAVFMLGVRVAQGALTINTSTNITSGVVDGGTPFNFGYSVSDIVMTISGGALINGAGTVGSQVGADRNKVEVSGSGVWTNTSTLIIGSSGTGNSVTVTNGGSLYAGLLSGGNSAVLGYSASGSNNWAVVTGDGSMWTNSTSTFLIGRSSNGNRLTVSNNGTFYAPGQLWMQYTNNTLQVLNGGKFYVGNTFNIGHSNSSNVTMLVSGADAVAQSSSSVNVGAQSGAQNCRLIISSGGVFQNNNNLYVGARGSLGAEVVVTGPGSMLGGTGNLLFGFSGSYPGTNGTLTILDGGLVKANGTEGLQFYGLNNMVTNNGGILQFTADTPKLTGLGTAGGVVMDGGTLSYSGVSNVNITNNCTATGVGLFVWQGKNTLRLDGSTATNALAAAYHFQTNQAQGAKNYVNLEMLGTSALRGKGVTIGDGGSLLVSDALATIGGPFTNNGTMTVADGTLVLSDTAAFNGTLNIDLSALNGTDCAITNNSLSLGADSVIAFAGTTALDTVPVIRHTGGRTGTFKTVSGVPTGYSLRYQEGGVTLLKLRGTMIRFQ